MTTDNKIPLNNSIVELKTNHNDMIDNQNRHGFFNLIANGRFEFVANDESIVDDIDNPQVN